MFLYFPESMKQKRTNHHQFEKPIGFDISRKRNNKENKKQ